VGRLPHNITNAIFKNSFVAEPFIIDIRFANKTMKRWKLIKSFVLLLCELSNEKVRIGKKQTYLVIIAKKFFQQKVTLTG
jgi:hypothetical protein